MARRDIDRLQGEIEELFADLWQVPASPASGTASGRRSTATSRGPAPADVVVVELAGVDPARSRSGRGATLTISASAPRRAIGGQVYQQAEIEYGQLRARIPLGHDVAAQLGVRDATRRDAPRSRCRSRSAPRAAGRRNRRPRERMSAELPTEARTAHGCRFSR
jgi:hypothetical protein